jgi:hypothetical protein
MNCVTHLCLAEFFLLLFGSFTCRPFLSSFIKHLMSCSTLGACLIFWSASYFRSEKLLPSFRVIEVVAQSLWVCKHHLWALTTRVKALAQSFKNWLIAVTRAKSALAKFACFNFWLKCAFSIDASCVYIKLALVATHGVLIQTFEFLATFFATRAATTCLLQYLTPVTH